MSGENQYINPIILAMAHLQQSRYQQAELAQRGQQHSDQMKIEQQRADQAAEELKNRQEYEQGTLKNASDLAASLQAQRHFEERRQSLEDASKFATIPGADVTKLYPPGKTPGNILLPSGDEINPAALGNPQAAADFALAQKVKETGAVTNAQQTALAPFVNAQREATDASEAKKLYQTHQNRLEELDKSGANTLAARQAEDAAMLARTKYEVGGHIAAAKISAGLGDGTGAAGYAVINQAKPLVDSIFNGEVDGSKLSKQQKALVNIWSQNTGEQVPNTTDYYKKVRQLDPLGRIVNNATDMATNFSTDSPNGGYLAAAQSKLLGTGDLDTAKKSFNSDVGTVVSMMDDQQRKALPEFQRTLEGMYSSIHNMQQNANSVQSARGNIQSHIDGILAGVSPDRKAIILQQHHLTDFYNPNQPSATNPQVAPGAPPNPQQGAPPNPTAGATHMWTPGGIVPIQQQQ